MIEITEDVATGTGHRTICRAQVRIVEELPPGLDHRALGREQIARREHAALRRIDDADAMRDARIDVQPRSRSIQCKTRGARRHRDVPTRIRLEPTRRQTRHRQRRHLGRTKGRDVERVPTRAEGERRRLRETFGLLRGRQTRALRQGEVNVLVQVHGRHRACSGSHHRQSTLSNTPSHRTVAAPAGALEAHLVEGLGVAHDETPIGGYCHVEQDGANATDALRNRRRRRGGVKHEHVFVRQCEFHARRPIVTRLVTPCRTVIANDESRGRCLYSISAGRQTGLWRVERIAMQHGTAIARHEYGRVHAAPVVTDGQSPRHIGRQGQRRDRLAIQRFIELRSIKHPYVRAPSGRRRQGRGGEARPVLPAECGADERSVTVGPGKHHIARLIADLECAQHPRRAVETHHAHRVREVIDHPDLVGVALGHGHGLEPDRYRAREAQRVAFDGVDLKAVRGRVRDIQALPVSRQRERANRTTLEYGHAVGRGVGRYVVRRRAALKHRPLQQRALRLLDGRSGHRSGRTARGRGRTRT